VRIRKTSNRGELKNDLWRSITSPAKIGSRTNGQCARAKAQYVLRLGPYAHEPDALAFARSGNLPAFAAGDPVAYFDAADLYERANGRLFKEVEVALPVELAPDEQRDLLDAFVPVLLAGEPLPYTLAVHQGQGHNPHCHVLLSERVNDGIARPATQWFRRFNARAPERGSARKTEALSKKGWLHDIRKAWAELVNRALERAGFLERVDHRTLRAQGIDRLPQIHLGPDVLRMEERGIRTGRGDQAQHIERRNDELAQRRAERARVDRAAEAERQERDRDNSRAPRGQGTRAGRAEREPHPVEQDRNDQPRIEGPASRDNADPERSLQQATRAQVDAARNPPEDARSADSGVSDWPKLEPRGTEPETAGAADRELPKAPDVPFGESESRDANERPVVDSEAATRDVREVDRRASPDDEIGGEHEVRGASASSRDVGAGTPPDRTARAVERQLRAMGGGRFEIGVREAETGQWMTRSGSAAEVLERLPWLKRMNAQGNDIYVRPAREQGKNGLVLVANLDRATLGALERGGRAPAVIVEGAPGRYEAWIRVGREAPAAALGRIARRLAEEYDADPDAASAHRYGRLAGFTNRSTEDRTTEGLPPFALLRGASGRVAPDGRALLREATLAIGRPDPSVEQGRGQDDVAPPRGRGGSREEAIELYRQEHAKLVRRTADVSRCDFGAAVRLAERGFDRETIAHAIRSGSPRLEERKPGHVDDYARRTSEAALREHTRAIEQTRSRDEGRER
jgi:hypothetical protein